MNRIMLVISLACFLLLGSGAAYTADTTGEPSFLISSVPDGAAVFQYMRGKNYFLGYTPLKVTKDDLHGKDNATIRLIRFGYKQKLLDLAVDDNNKTVALEPELPPHVVNQGEIPASLAKCKSEIDDAISNLTRKRITGQIAFQHPFFLSKTPEGSEITIVSTILNHSDIKKIKKIERMGGEGLIPYIERLISPAASQLIKEFEKLECLVTVAIVARYKHVGLKMEYTPYLKHWSRTSSYVVGNTQYTTTVYGSNTELDSDMKQTKEDKSIIIRYKLR